MFHTAVAFDVRFSVTVRQDKRISAAIAAIDEQAWQPIPYWLSSPEVSGADVAETTYTAFTGKHALPVSADRPSRPPDPRIAARAVHHLELPRVRHGPTRTDAPVEDLDAAVQYVAELDAAGGEGGYARVTTISSPLSPGKRGDVELTAALPGLRADLDIAGPGHKPPVNGLPLPPDEAAVRAIVAESGLPKPTLWQHSGGEYYAWWLLQEPFATSPEQLSGVQRCRPAGSKRWAPQRIGSGGTTESVSVTWRGCYGSPA